MIVPLPTRPPLRKMKQRSWPWTPLQGFCPSVPRPGRSDHPDKILTGISFKEFVRMFPHPHTRLPFMAMDPTCLPFIAMGWGEIAKTRRQCGTGEKCLRRSGSRAPLTGTARIKAEHWRTVRARSERANQRSNMLDRAATDDSRWRMGVPIVIVTRLCPHCGGSLSAIMSDVWPQMTLTFHLGCACQVRLIGDE
jgi:hypothetical protein